jgi:2-keto-3-deoxygluconate permease
MKILKTVNKIPGGMMVVPLFVGVLLNTFFPYTSNYFGSFTEGLIKGTTPILAVWFVCLGSSIKLKEVGTVLRKSGTLLITKIITAWVIAIIFSNFLGMGMIETGFFSGLSVIALVASMDMTNTGLYASLMEEYGTKEESGAFILMNVESGPLMTMLILGSSGIASFKIHSLIAVIIPFLLGFIFGNLDKDISKFLSNGIPILIPFFAFALGNGIDLSVVQKTGLLGIVMAISVVIITGIPLILADIFIGKGNGLAGIAASSTAGAAVATPQLVADVSPQFSKVVPEATALVATSILVTSIIVPIITGLYYKYISNSNFISKLVRKRKTIIK